ncbi:STAS domain-containing protein [Kitasatospora sp. A2-31]|uniref:STAS domain-containing protein n=1 Tax=Kitasatospora sp. A2-31 TaxID=2916414 RepID=UPI001EEB2010|nr:STAS domain-containing protein [Kitasatospora sp. A2-31]MCG6494103.1 STAS domain-containing protein [Kitasatospora sp. A2-31]
MESGLSTNHRPALPGTLVLALAGYADVDTAPALARALQGALTATPPPHTLVIDCAELDFCSAAGLNELLRARRGAAEAGIVFRLAAPSRQVSRLLDVTGTATVFELATSTQAPPRPLRPLGPLRPLRLVPRGSAPPDWC